MNTFNFQMTSDTELQKVTGKTWKEWCEILDVWEGNPKKLSTIVLYLTQQYKLRRLYAQMIAVYYKQDWCSTQRTG